MVSKTDPGKFFKINFKNMRIQITSDMKKMIAFVVDRIHNIIYNINAKLNKNRTKQTMKQK